MPTASTVASIIVALAVLAVVVRWPRLPADRRMLERRAQGLEALGTVVARSAESRAPAPPGTRPSDATSPAIRSGSAAEHATTIDGATGDHPAPLHRTAQIRSEATAGTDAVTVLGPVDGTRPRADRHAALRARRSPPRHRHAPRPTRPTGPAEVLHIGAPDLPPDDDLTETTDALHPRHADAGIGPSRASTPGHTAGVPTPALPNPPRPSRPAPRFPGGRVVVAATVAIVVGGAVMVGVRTGSGPADPTDGETAAAAQAPTPTPSPDPSPPAVLTPTGTSGDVVTFPATAPFTLDLAAGAPSWVRIQGASGAVLFEGTLAAGEQTSVRAEEPVRIRLGNSGGVLTAADGDLLDHPRTAGQPLTLALG